MTGPASALYECTVVHRRVRPVPHHLAYRVFAPLLDLDELPRLQRQLRLFGYNRPRLVSFYDRDHGPGDGTELRDWVRQQLQAARLPADGSLRALCFPRIFGYVFNPLTVIYCHNRDGTLAAILYEVNNTFGQRHSYLIPAVADGDGVIRQTCDKRLYVSPFMPMETIYTFRIRPPDQRLAVAIRQSDAGGPLLHAVMTGRRRALSDAALARMLLRYPMMTLTVIAAIHWEAFRLWRKGLPLVSRDPAPVNAVSLSDGGEPLVRTRPSS